MDHAPKTLSSMINNGKYSDLEIRCGGASFKVHRAVVCSFSKVMDRECGEKGFQEANSSIIVHTEYDALAMERMITFMYNGDYQVSTPPPPTPPPPPPPPQLPPVVDQQATVGNAVPASVGQARAAAIIQQCVDYNSTEGSAVTVESGLADCSVPSSQTQMNGKKRKRAADTDEIPRLGINQFVAHVNVFGLADYYDLPSLQALAIQKFKKERLRCSTIPDFEMMEIIVAVYQTTYNDHAGLRQEVVELCLDHFKALIQSKKFMKALGERSDYQEFSANLVTGLSQRCKRELEVEQLSHQAVGEALQDDIVKLRVNGKAMLLQRQADQKRICELEANSVSTNQELDSRGRAHLATQTRLSELETVVDRIAKSAYSTTEELIALTQIKACRHCNKEFNFYISCDFGGKWHARCRACKTRHCMASATIT